MRDRLISSRFFELVCSDGAGPTPRVFVEVRGPDRVGFLGSLLERLRDIWLFPEQMSVETWGGQARDTFYLRSPRPGARLRSEESAREVAAVLESLRETD